MRSFVFWLIITVAAALLFPRGIVAHETGIHQIEMTAAGFTPLGLEITAGETVIFRNTDTVTHWPASNIHPTHRIYPEFDSRRPIMPGESWQFSFAKSGVWRYHDHLRPELTGTVTVIGSKTGDQGYRTRGEGLGEKIGDQWGNIMASLRVWGQQIYFKIFPDRLDRAFLQVNMQKLAVEEEKIIYWLKMAGVKKVMDKLIADSGRGTIVDCHQEAHLVGRKAYGIYGARVFRDGSSLCHSGFYHGAMESFLSEKGMENLAANVLDLCSNFVTNFGNFECLHGVGHGVLALVDYDLPEALRVCQKLDTDFEKTSCYGGIFMENIVVAEGNGARPAHETKWVSADPHFPCNAIDKDSEIQHQCYYMQTSRMLNLFGHNYQRIVKECLRSPAEYVAACFQSLGRDVAGQSLRAAEKIREVCLLVPAEYFGRCVEGGLNVIIDFWGENLTDQAAGLCGILDLEQNKRRCFEVLGRRLQGIFGRKEEIERRCAFVDVNYRGACLYPPQSKLFRANFF